MSETSERSSENEKRPRGSRRRQVHNEVERRRKDKINGWISKIGELLPCKELHKQSKISILEQTVDYIKLLVSEKDKLLSENCSEVQAEEIKKLKRDIKILSEQNTLYEKLLEQSNVTLKPLPSKELKYSNKFVKKNGVLTVKNADSNITHVDSAVQVNSMCLNIPTSNAVNCTSSSTKESTPVSSSRTSKNNKSSIKSAPNSLKPVKIVSSVTTCSVVKSSAPIVCIQSSSASSSSYPTQTVQCSKSVSEENEIPVINWNDPTRNPTSFHAGGVTTVLSQFPVMSTNHGSSFSNICNKNLPTFIIPTGGGIVQQFLTEKPSNTINVICPSTLPILVPQQVFSVPSVARNVALPSTIICSAPVDNSTSQVDKSTLGGTLLTINSNSVVPISSSFPANTRIILQSQPTMVGNNCSNVNLTQNIVTPFVTTVSQAQSDSNTTVPLIQKQPVSSPSKNNEALTNVTNNASIFKVNKQETKAIKNALENSKDMPILTSHTLPLSTSKDTGTPVKFTSQNKTKKLNRDIINLYSNSPPSLQVLSANKIIYLANKSSKKVNTNILLPLEKKSVEKVTSQCVPVVTQSNSSKSLNNNLQVLSPEKRSQKEVNEPQADKKPIKSNVEHPQVSESNLAKSSFSLTVLIGDSLSEKETTKSKISEQDHTILPMHKDVTSSQSVRIQPKNVSCTTNSSLISSQFSNASEYVAISSMIKQNNLESSVQVNKLSTVCESESDVLSGRINMPDSKNFNNQSLENGIAHNSLNSMPTSNNSSETCKDVSSDHIGSVVNNNTVSYNVNAQIITPKQNSSYSSKSDIQSLNDANHVQNDQNQLSSTTSEIPNSLMNAYRANVPYTINDSSVNQSLLPSLFSNNQIVGLNSSILVCHTAHDTSGLLLPNSIQVSSDTTAEALNNCLLHDASSEFHAFSVLNKDVSISDDPPKKTPDCVSNCSTNSNSNTVSLNNSCDINQAEKNKVLHENDCNKQLSISKMKRKSTSKESKSNSTDKILNNNESQMGVSNNSLMSSTQTTETLSKSDSSNFTRQDSNYIFSPDILARAAESIFSNDILESPQMPKRNEGCYTDESSNLNGTLSTSEKAMDEGYRMHYNCIEENHNITETSPEKSKKATSQLQLQQHSNVSDPHNLQQIERNVQELSPKQNKLCKGRKSKSVGDSEPPCKKLKEASQSSEKTLNMHTFNHSHQTNKDNKHISNIHSNLSYLEKQVSDPSETSVEDQNGVGSIGNFPNQIHLPDNSCKTPSVDTIFSLTPMLGDILKDVSHSVNLDSRSSNFLMGNENQSIYSSEKNIIFNYSNNSNEDYLNLPRFPFPIIPEVSAAPIVHVTNVSFAHSVSLCSTQSDSQKSTETLASTDSQNKSNSKQKDILPVYHNNNTINMELNSSSNMPKQSECVLKVNNSESHFNITSAKVSSNNSEPQYNMTSAKVTNTNSVLFDGQNSDVQSQNPNSIHSTNLVVSHSGSQYNPRDNFLPTVTPHTISFYPCISTSSNMQNFACTTTSAPHVSYHNNSSSVGSVSTSFQTSINNNSFNSQPVLSKPDSLSHSLCSLLKENSNVSENRVGSSEVSSQNTSSSSNIAQSKYSALSLISDQTSYSESVSVTTCHPQFVQTSTVYTTSGSDGQYASTASSCSRNPKTSLSYSAESLLQTSCANSEKNKNKNNNNSRYPLRTAEKKADRTSLANVHSMSDTNIFMPVSNCDISLQNAPLVPLPPVTSFHNFSSAYTVCDTAPTTIFNSVSRTQDIPLSHSNENYHMNLNVDSQILNRHDVSAVPKPHSNIPLPFENHNALYNNCNFLPHVKPTMEGSRSSEASACFQTSSYGNNYTQPSHKPNCCHFSHRTSSSELTSEINSSAVVTAASFHNDKNNFQTNRTSLQAPFCQSNSNFMGNYFYNTTANCRDGNDMSIKPSTIRTSQEIYVPDGVRQNIHDQNSGVVFNNRKTMQSNRAKSKKPKNTSSNENNNSIPACITNYSSSQDSSCNKANLPYIPNGYFKSGSHPVLPPPAQLQCAQNKISEGVTPSGIPPNPQFNPVLHQQSENFLNLNFQHPNFTMSPLPRPPTQPLSCSCLTTPIISHTFSSSTPHPVPNFNLSNILQDMGCSGNQVTFSPAKFPMNHSLASSSTQCPTNPTITNSAHIVSHQSCAPSLYPPHPPMVRGSLNPILGPNSQSLIDSQVSLVGTAGAVMSQNTLHTKIHCNTKAFFS